MTVHPAAQTPTKRERARDMEVNGYKIEIGADLQDADLRGTDLRGTDLRRADLRYADLQDADLQRADLRCADLRGANLRGAGLQRADLRGADLRGADLRGANLQDAVLQDARGGILSVTRLPSGDARLLPTCDGWVLHVGCWTGTTESLRDLIAQEDDWPAATGDEITRRSPMLAALADLCDAYSAAHADDLAAVAHWDAEAATA